MAKKVNVEDELEDTSLLPIVKSISIVKTNNKFSCFVISSQGKSIVDIKELGQAGGLGFAVIEFKRWAQELFRSL